MPSICIYSGLVFKVWVWVWVGVLRPCGHLQGENIESYTIDYSMNEIRRKPTTGRNTPFLFSISGTGSFIWFQSEGVLLCFISFNPSPTPSPSSNPIAPVVPTPHTHTHGQKMTLSNLCKLSLGNVQVSQLFQFLSWNGKICLQGPILWMSVWCEYICRPYLVSEM